MIVLKTNMKRVNVYLCDTYDLVMNILSKTFKKSLPSFQLLCLCSVCLSIWFGEHFLARKYYTYMYYPLVFIYSILKFDI